jgi:tRNA uridine 5-carbamoylmethylation protein Kti12
MNKTLWIMCGAPASGKSGFAKNKLMKDWNWDYVSRDEVRFSIVKDNEEYFSHEKEVFNEFVEKIAVALVWGSDNIIADATHLNWGSRRKLLNALKKYYPMETLDVIPVVIDAKLEDILERNALRDGRARVPEEVVRDMYSRMNDPEKDPYKYAAIMRVRN